MSAFFGVPGPMEILIILFILALLVGFFAVVSKRRPPPTTATCPRCGGWLAAQARFCHHCGTALPPPQDPFEQ